MALREQTNETVTKGCDGETQQRAGTQSRVGVSDALPRNGLLR